MRNLFIIFAFLFSSFVYANTVDTSKVKHQLCGTWKIENILYTFTNDNLYIDEIGNEGDEYTYSVKIIDDFIIVTAICEYLDDTFKFIISCLSPEKMRIFVLNTGVEDQDACFTLTKIKQ